MVSVYAGITNNQGECTISYIIGSSDTSMTINANTLSNNVNILVLLFYDACDDSSRISTYYATSIPLRNNGVSSISYDSTNNYYVINNDTDYESFIEILPLTGVTNDFKVNAYGKVLSQSQSLGFGVYFDTNNWYHLKVEQNTKVWVSKNVNGVFSETSYNTSEGTGNNIRVEWVMDDTNNEFIVNFKREDGTLVLSKTQPIPSLTSTTKYGFVSSWWRNAKVAIYEIKAEQL